MLQTDNKKNNQVALSEEIKQLKEENEKLQLHIDVLNDRLQHGQVRYEALPLGVIK